MRTRTASAGTGKTTALVTSILEDVLNGTPLLRIAAATFTRRASADLRDNLRNSIERLTSTHAHHHLTINPNDHLARERLQRARDELPSAPIGTIHALMRTLLRLRAPALALDPAFELLTESDAQRIFLEELTTHAYLNDLDLNQREREQHLTLFANRSLARAYTSDPNDPNANALITRHASIMQRYYARLDRRALGPADTELACVTASDDPNTIARWKERITILYIDEAQDVSVLQAELIQALARAGIRTTLIGDPKQSIYAFRAASIESFRALANTATPEPPLTTTYRHARRITSFLNDLTSSVASDNTGFASHEAPTITSHRTDPGSVTAIWSVGPNPISELREHEADLAARALKDLHQRERIPYRDMAILIRSSGSESDIRPALERHAIPANRVQGRDYYQRPEVRLVQHALRFMLDPRNPARIAPLLMSALAPLDANDTLNALNAGEHAREHIQQHHPTVHEALTRIANLRDENPTRILNEILQHPIPNSDHRYIDTLDQQALDNTLALYADLARSDHLSLEALAQRLEHLIQHEHDGSVPQSGDGVRITTWHASKGLEWRVTLVFDLGRTTRHTTPTVITEHATGLTSTSGSTYEDLTNLDKTRAQHEHERLAYVAMSRASEHLILTGSRKGKSGGNATIKRLTTIKLGPDHDHEAPPYASVTTSTHPGTSITSSTNTSTRARAALPESDWTHRTFTPTEPLVQRPSHTRSTTSTADDTRPAPTDLVPAIIGVLTHHAIARDWNPSNDRDRAALASQSALAPLTSAERDRVLKNVHELLTNLHGMRADGTLASTEQHHNDVPFLMRDQDGRTWQGTIDQLCKLTRSNEWVVRDYKTDASVNPERHAAQVQLYARAASAWVGRSVRGELVYLRHKRVIPIETEPTT